MIPRKLKSPITVAILTSVVMFIFAVAIGKASTDNLAKAEYHDCQERNVIVDQENQQSQGIVAILEQTKAAFESGRFGPPTPTTNDAIARYDALIAASGPKPQFNCRVYLQ